MFGECAQANLLTIHKEIADREQTNIITQYYIPQQITEYTLVWIVHSLYIITQYSIP